MQKKAGKQRLSGKSFVCAFWNFNGRNEIHVFSKEYVPAVSYLPFPVRAGPGVVLIPIILYAEQICRELPLIRFADVQPQMKPAGFRPDIPQLRDE